MPQWPVAAFELRRTSCYGCVRNSPSDGACGVSGYPCVHYGMDLFGGADRTVVAPESGTVVAVADGKSAPFSGYGPGVVLILGTSGRYLLLAHLAYSSITVRKGDQIAEGEPIALFDAGAGHVHFEVRKQATGPSKTNTIDPRDWVRGFSLISIIALGVGAWWITRWTQTA